MIVMFSHLSTTTHIKSHQSAYEINESQQFAETANSWNHWQILIIAIIIVLILPIFSHFIFYDLNYFHCLAGMTAINFSTFFVFIAFRCLHYSPCTLFFCTLHSQNALALVNTAWFALVTNQSTCHCAPHTKVGNEEVQLVCLQFNNLMSLMSQRFAPMLFSIFCVITVCTHWDQL